jgi:hypothetical protein
LYWIRLAPYRDVTGDAADPAGHAEAVRAAAAVYESAFRPLGLLTAPTALGSGLPHPAYLVQTRDPSALVAALAVRGIEACRMSDDHTVALPCHPDLDLDDLLYVADAVRLHLQGLSARS